MLSLSQIFCILQSIFSKRGLSLRSEAGGVMHPEWPAQQLSCDQRTMGTVETRGGTRSQSHLTIPGFSLVRSRKHGLPLADGVTL